MNTSYMRILVCIAIFSLSACEPSDSPLSSTAPLSNLSQEIAEAEERSVFSARTQLQNAQNAFLQVSGQLLTISSELEVYQYIQQRVLPSLLAATQSIIQLSPEEQKPLTTELQNLFNEIATQMLNGINTNLAFYQGNTESQQALGLSPQELNTDLNTLNSLFQKTELTEHFIAQLAQFNQILPGASDALRAVRSQQSVAINGILFASQHMSPQSIEVKQAYMTMVQSLQRPELLAQLAQLARLAYGNQAVALRTNELTPTQTNPNLVQMVVQENSDRYRFIRLDQQKLVNEILIDSRGLSASDMLYQSNVVVMRSPLAQTNASQSPML